MIFDMFFNYIGLLPINEISLLTEHPSQFITDIIIFPETSTNNIITSNVSQRMGVEPHDMINDFNR